MRLGRSPGDRRGNTALMERERGEYGPIRTALDRGVVTATIVSPPLNLVDGAFIGGLLGLLADLEADPDVRAVVFISTDPDFFLMHGDVEQLLGMVSTYDGFVDGPNVAAATFERLHRAPFVTIGAIDGAARGGGCEFLSALDLRVGSERTVIGQPEVAMGILPGAGGSVRWPRLVGRAAALDVLLTGRDVSAAEALALGWLQRLVPSDQVVDVALELAHAIAAMPAASIAAIKQVVDASLGVADDALTTESDHLGRLMSTGAHTAPMQRFLAAGGQTRAGERGSLGPLIDAMTRSAQPPEPPPVTS